MPKEFKRIKYIHLSTGNEYEKILIGKVQIDKVWDFCVVYQCPKGKIYVRKRHDFKRNFKKVVINK
jgi:hypothetical protein